MRRAVTLPRSARATFAAALKELSDHAAALPDPLPVRRVLRLFDRTLPSDPGMRPPEDEDIKVLADIDERGWFLDYFRVSNDGELAWHGRIREDGTLEELENYEGQISRRVFPDDPARTAAELERIVAHNARVHEILRAKGFV